MPNRDKLLEDAINAILKLDYKQVMQLNFSLGDHILHMTQLRDMQWREANAELKSAADELLRQKKDLEERLSDIQMH